MVRRQAFGTGGALGVLVATATALLVTASAASAQSTAPAAATAAAAAPKPEDRFTVQNVIGDAVSLSNQKYPEVEKAIQRFKNSDLQGAREFLELASQKYPKLPPVEVSLAKLFFLAGDVDNGRALLELAVTKYPADPEAYLLLADQSFAENRTVEAHAVFEKAVEVVKTYTDNVKRKRNFEVRVLAGLAAVRERREQWDAAAELLKKWLVQDPDSYAAHQRYGVVLFRQKKPTEAYNEFVQARKLRADLNNPNVLLGQLYSQTGDIDKARAAFEKAYAEEKTNESTARAYANWLVQQDQLDKAQSVASELRKQVPDSVQALLLEGLIYKMRGDLKASEASLVQVLGIDPGNAGAADLLALLLIDSKNMADKEKALRYAKLNVERFPQSAQAQVTLAWVLFALDRPTEARQVLAQISPTAQLVPDSTYLVARIFAKQGKTQEAIAALQDIIRRYPAGAFTQRKDAQKLLKELGGTELPAADSKAPTGATAPPPVATPAAAPVPAAGGAKAEPPAAK